MQVWYLCHAPYFKYKLLYQTRPNNIGSMKNVRVPYDCYYNNSTPIIVGFLMVTNISTKNLQLNVVLILLLQQMRTGTRASHARLAFLLLISKIIIVNRSFYCAERSLVAWAVIYYDVMSECNLRG